MTAQSAAIATLPATLTVEEPANGEATLKTSGFNSFEEFYPFYLSQHENVTCRRLHILGSSLGLAGLGAAVLTGKKRYLLAGVVAGYGCAWVGHFFFEHNKPATFSHPVYSFMGDWVMFKDVLTGKIPF